MHHESLYVYVYRERGNGVLEDLLPQEYAGDEDQMEDNAKTPQLPCFQTRHVLASDVLQLENKAITFSPGLLFVDSSKGRNSLWWCFAFDLMEAGEKCMCF